MNWLSLVERLTLIAREKENKTISGDSVLIVYPLLFSICLPQHISFPGLSFFTFTFFRCLYPSSFRSNGSNCDEVERTDPIGYAFSPPRNRSEILLTDYNDFLQCDQTPRGNNLRMTQTTKNLLNHTETTIFSAQRFLPTFLKRKTVQ